MIMKWAHLKIIVVMSFTETEMKGRTACGRHGDIAKEDLPSSVPHSSHCTALAAHGVVEYFVIAECMNDLNVLYFRLEY